MYHPRYQESGQTLKDVNTRKVSSNLIEGLRDSKSAIIFEFIDACRLSTIYFNLLVFFRIPLDEKKTTIDGKRLSSYKKENEEFKPKFYLVTIILSINIAKM